MVTMQNEVRWLALCGLGAPVFHLLIPLWLGAIDHGYSPMRQYISELALPDRPYGRVVNFCFVVAGLLTIGLAGGLYWSLPRNTVSWIAPLLLLFHGISNILAGIFVVDAKSMAGKIHTIFGQAGSNASVILPFFAWLTIRLDPQWRDVALFSLVMQIIIAVAFVLFAFVTETRNRASSRAIIGLCQRLFLGVYYTWVVGIAVWLILKS